MNKKKLACQSPAIIGQTDEHGIANRNTQLRDSLQIRDLRTFLKRSAFQKQCDLRHLTGRRCKDRQPLEISRPSCQRRQPRCPLKGAASRVQNHQQIDDINRVVLRRAGVISRTIARGSPHHRRRRQCPCTRRPRHESFRIFGHRTESRHRRQKDDSSRGKGFSCANLVRQRPVHQLRHPIGQKNRPPA